jgi:hypothetical protein
MITGSICTPFCYSSSVSSGEGGAHGAMFRTDDFIDEWEGGGGLCEANGGWGMTLENFNDSDGEVSVWV